MKTHKPTKTATVKDMRSLTNAAEKHATVAETAAEQARHSSDTAREHTSRTYRNMIEATQYAVNASIHAEDAATYAHTARWCLILTIIINTAYCIIFYTLQH